MVSRLMPDEFTSSSTFFRKDNVEPTIGIEPMNLFLTKEALYRLSYVGAMFIFEGFQLMGTHGTERNMERETRLELATFSLEG